MTKKWIEACFSEQKKIPWRRFALDNDDQDEPESDEEIRAEKKSSPSKQKLSQSCSDDDMVVVDKRPKNGDGDKKEDPKPKLIDLDSDEDMVIVDKRKVNGEATQLIPADSITKVTQNVMDISTDDELMSKSANGSTSSLTQADNQVYKNKTFYLNEDLPATDVIKLKNQITSMDGRVTEKPAKANYIIAASGKRLPQGVSGEALTRYEHIFSLSIQIFLFHPNFPASGFTNVTKSKH